VQTVGLLQIAQPASVALQGEHCAIPASAKPEIQLQTPPEGAAILEIFGLQVEHEEDEFPTAQVRHE